ncbi:centromere protein H [Amia ocellicauda]|uniref:centromere protein H n=1 Tax=Amia ocellicauda TaxID=2972642 RepID=UPI0034643EEF
MATAGAEGSCPDRAAGRTGGMEVFEKLEGLSLELGQEALSSCQSPLTASCEEQESLTHLLRIKEQVANQCFEMRVKVNAEQGKDFQDIITDENQNTCELERDLEDSKLSYCNTILALHRMQVSQAVLEKLEHNDKEAELMKATVNHSRGLCSRIMKLQQESSQLEQQVLEIRKKRLVLKKQAHRELKELQELKNTREHVREGKYSEVLKKGQTNLEKYMKMVVVIQNVLKDIILSSKVNWTADPKLRGIVLGLERNPALD